MAFKTLIVSFAVLLAVMVTVMAEPEPTPSYASKPVATRYVHYHGEPLSRYVYTRHLHYHEPTHAHVVKYYAPAHPHVHEDYVDYHYDPHHYHHHHV